MKSGHYWFEVRATSPGLLESLPLETGKPPDRAEAYPQVLNLVYEPAGKEQRPRTRRLPALYFGGSLAFSDRSIVSVEKRLTTAIKQIDSARHRPTFHLQACRYRDKYGFYAADFNVRSRFRRSLVREGLEISQDPFVTMRSTGQFRSDDLDPFRPSFAIVSTNEQGSPSGAKLLFSITSRRLGLIPTGEFKHLSEHLEAVAPLGGQPASEIAGRIENLP